MAPRPVTGHQGGARRVLEHSSLKAGSAVSPAGRYLVQIRHGRLSSSDKRRPGGSRKERRGIGRDPRGRLKAGMRRRAGWPGMGCRRGAWPGGPRSTAQSVGRQDGEGRPRAAWCCGRGQARPVRGGARRRQGLAYFFFIMSKNSALVLVTRILSRMNSMDCTSSMSWMNLRSTQTFCSRSGAISSSSRRVPDLFRLMAG